MDLSGLSSLRRDYSELLENLSTTKKTVNSSNFLKSKSNILNQDNKISSPASNIIIVKRGEAGYMKQMDTDDNGEVSLEEFNKYCEENGVETKEKIALLTAIQSAKSNLKTVNNSLKQEETSENNEAEAVYAKKGDTNYDSKMDENQNGVITYKEYYEYNNKDKTKAESKKETSSSGEKPQEQTTNPQDSVSLKSATKSYCEGSNEMLSTVEYEV